MRYSIPHLTGWSQQLDIAMQNQISESVNPKGSRYNSGGGYSQGGGGDLPF